MDIQTASSVGSLFASPTAGNLALMSIPVLFGALLWSFREHHKKMLQQYHDSLDLIAQQNKEMIDMNAVIKDLEAAQHRNVERSADLKEQIDRLFEELEKTRDEISVSYRYGQNDEYDDQYGQVPAAHNEGISDLLRSLEDRPVPTPEVEPEPSPSMTQIQKQAEFYAQHAEAAYQRAENARRKEPPAAQPAPPQQAANPDMTQSLFAQVKQTDTQFDLQDYL